MVEQDQAGIFVNRAGQPTGTALTFPTTPGAIAAAGMHVLAACTDAMHVYDRTSAVLVQSLPYLEGAQPTPGQRLLTSHDPRGSCICLAGLRKVRAWQREVCPAHCNEILSGLPTTNQPFSDCGCAWPLKGLGHGHWSKVHCYPDVDTANDLQAVGI